MKNKAILLSILLLASGAAFAQSLLNSAGQSLEGAAQNQAEDAAKQKALQAAPSGVQQNIQTLQTDKDQAQQLKGTLDAAPSTPGGAVDAVEGQAKQKAAGKALDLLQ